MASPYVRIQNWINYRYFILLCLILGVACRLLWIIIIDADQVSDYRWYEERARSIAHGTGYAVDGRPTAYWPIGYPGFLGLLFYLCGPSVLVAKLANIALYEGVIGLGYVLSKRLFHSDNAARITTCLLCFYPNHIAYTALLSTEILFVFLLLSGASLLLFARQRIWALGAAGIVWGAATLTKPQALLLPIVLVLVMYPDIKSRLRAAVVVYAATATLLLPWMIRNYRLFGKAMLSTNGGIVLFISNNPYATGRHMWNAQLTALLGPLAADETGMFDGKEVAREKEATRVATDYIVHHPWQTVKLWPRKLLALYLSDVDGIYYSLGFTSYRDRIGMLMEGVKTVAELYYILIIGLCCVALPRVLASKQPQTFIVIWIVMYFKAIYVITIGNARYHFAIMPWIAVYAGLGGEWILAVRTKGVSGNSGSS